ncbi:MAG: insulinase family protein, partial [Treponema sp.]|nr:insulinase family protein [Treponema sp.]
MSIDSIVLNNGIMLITEPIAMAKTVAIGFYFSVGSRYEQKDNRGITHFMEHMLFKGTKTRSYSDISKTFDRMGGYFNAFTEKETVCVHATIPLLNSTSNNSLKRALEVLCDMTQNSIFPKAEYEKEAEVVKSEILSAEDDFEECAFDSVEKLLWKNQILGENVSGSVADIDLITREQMYSWYDKYIAHGELLVCVAGNIDVELIKNMLEQLPEHKVFDAKLKHFSETAVWSKGFNFVKSDFRQEQIFILYPFKCPLSENDYYSLSVLNAIMGDTMSSRFFQSIREKLGLCYNIYS